MGITQILFWILSIIALFSAVMMVTSKNPVYSVLWLIVTFFSISGHYILLNAQFLAVVNIIVYAGAIMVLFLFVIMLVNVGAEERGNQPIMNKPRQVTTSMIFCLLLVLGLLFAINVGYRGLQKRNPLPPAGVVQTGQTLASGGTGTSQITTDTQRVGNSLYRFAALPFEIASVLLLVAIIGSVMLARTLKQEAAVDDLAPEVLVAETAREPELAGVTPVSEEVS